MLSKVVLAACLALTASFPAWAGENPNAKLAMHVVATDEYLDCADLIPAACESINVDVSEEEILAANGYGYVALVAYDVEGITGAEFAVNGWPTGRGAPVDGPTWCREGVLTLGDHMNGGGIASFPCAEAPSSGIVLLAYLSFGPLNEEVLPIELEYALSSFTYPNDPHNYVLDCTMYYQEDRIAAHTGCTIGGSFTGTAPECGGGLDGGNGGEDPGDGAGGVDGGSPMEVLSEEGEPIDTSTEGPYLPGRVVVRFLSGVVGAAIDMVEVPVEEVQHEAVRGVLDSLGCTQLRRLFVNHPGPEVVIIPNGRTVLLPDLSEVYVVELAGGVAVPSAVATLGKLAEVAYAEPDWILTCSASPNDSLYASQWALEKIKAPTAWSLTTGRRSVKVGIVDTGTDYVHRDLGHGFGPSFKVVGGYDYYNDDGNPMDDVSGTYDSHGTHVTGIAGALTNNLHGIAGVGGGWSSDSLGSQLYAFKVSDAEGNIASSTAAEAIRDAWPEYGVQVLNASFGGYDYSETQRGALCSHYQCGGILVASKGNKGTDDWHYPSDYDASWVISVGATNRFDDRASSSNFGNGIDLVAPGVSIWSDVRTVHDPPYGSKSGTSMAAPHVTGTVGLVLSCDWWQYPEDIQGVIRAAADEIPPPADPIPGYDDYYGDGRLNAYQAVLFSDSLYTYDRYRENGGSVVGITDWYTMRYVGDPVGDLCSGCYYKVKRYEVRKDVLYEPPYFLQGPYVWGVGEGPSTGWSAANPNYGVGYSSVVSGSETSEGCTLRTYVYDVYTYLGTPLGWYPCAPGEAYMACAVLGSLFGSVGEELPVERRVTASHPNPCVHQAQIGYSLARSSWVKIAVYDVTGRRVNILVDGMRAAGEHSVVWNGQDSSGREVGSGVYFYRFETADRTKTGRMVWVR